jgi:site-specific DNA-methyltransferase (adenine-specific)
MIPGVELLHGSAESLLRFAPEVHVQISDPPYSPHVHDSATSVNAPGGGKGVAKRDLGFDALTPELRLTLAVSAARVQRWSLIYSDIEGIGRWRKACTSVGAEYIRVVPWVRWSQPQLSGDRPSQGWEALSIFHSMHIGKRGGRKPKKKHWNGPGELVDLQHVPLDYLEHKVLRGAQKNKAEKPLDQALDLVSWFSDPGELIVDFTLGRGTTPLACRILGRRFVGTEFRKEEHALACERVYSDRLSARDAERVLRFVERVNLEDPVPSKFAPAVRRQRAREKSALRALRYLEAHAPR